MTSFEPEEEYLQLFRCARYNRIDVAAHDKQKLFRHAMTLVMRVKETADEKFVAYDVLRGLLSSGYDLSADKEFAEQQIRDYFEHGFTKVSADDVRFSDCASDLIPSILGPEYPYLHLATGKLSITKVRAVAGLLGSLMSKQMGAMQHVEFILKQFEDLLNSSPSAERNGDEIAEGEAARVDWETLKWDSIYPMMQTLADGLMHVEGWSPELIMSAFKCALRTLHYRTYDDQLIREVILKLSPEQTSQLLESSFALMDSFNPNEEPSRDLLMQLRLAPHFYRSESPHAKKMWVDRSPELLKKLIALSHYSQQSLDDIYRDYQIPQASTSSTTIGSTTSSATSSEEDDDEDYLPLQKETARQLARNLAISALYYIPEEMRDQVITEVIHLVKSTEDLIAKEAALFTLDALIQANNAMLKKYVAELVPILKPIIMENTSVHLADKNKYALLCAIKLDACELIYFIGTSHTYHIGFLDRIYRPLAAGFTFPTTLSLLSITDIQDVINYLYAEMQKPCPLDFIRDAGLVFQCEGEFSSSQALGILEAIHRSTVMTSTTITQKQDCYHFVSKAVERMILSNALVSTPHSLQLVEELIMHMYQWRRYVRTFEEIIDNMIESPFLRPLVPTILQKVLLPSLHRKLGKVVYMRENGISAIEKCLEILGEEATVEYLTESLFEALLKAAEDPHTGIEASAFGALRFYSILLQDKNAASKYPWLVAKIPHIQKMILEHIEDSQSRSWHISTYLVLDAFASTMEEHLDRIMNAMLTFLASPATNFFFTRPEHLSIMSCIPVVAFAKLVVTFPEKAVSRAHQFFEHFQHLLSLHKLEGPVAVDVVTATSTIISRNLHSDGIFNLFFHEPSSEREVQSLETISQACKLLLKPNPQDLPHGLRMTVMSQLQYIKMMTPKGWYNSTIAAQCQNSAFYDRSSPAAMSFSHSLSDICCKTQH